MTADGTALGRIAVQYAKTEITSQVFREALYKANQQELREVIFYLCGYIETLLEITGK